MKKTGRRGPFWGCLRFPSCKGSADYDPKDDRVAQTLGQSPGVIIPDTGGADIPFCPDDPGDDVVARPDPLLNFFNCSNPRKA